VKRKALLRRFGSVAGVREASVEQLAATPGIGPDLARAILGALRRD
jgi:excinuclease ABC subunit C